MSAHAHKSSQGCFLLARVSPNSASVSSLLRIEKTFVLTDPMYLYKTDPNNFKYVGIYDIVAYGS